MKRAASFILIFLLLFVSCDREQALRENEIVLGTLAEITFFSEDERQIVDDCFSLIRQDQQVFDRHREGSELFHVNENAFSSPVKVSGKLFGLIRLSLEIAEDTGGAFNPAIGPLVDLWGIGTESARVPSDDEIKAVLPLLDYRNIILDEEEMTVSFAVDGMSIDLGGIAKGMISDDAALFLRENGVEKAIINLGGDVYAIGEKKKGTPWRIGIQDPDTARGGLFATVEASDQTVVTSGAYERFLEKDGEIYHHILDSRTGYPAESGVLSSTIISDDGAVADALSTACFVMGKEKARAVLELYDCSAVFMDADRNVSEY